MPRKTPLVLAQQGISDTKRGTSEDKEGDDGYHSLDGVSPVDDFESNDSVCEFKSNLRKLLPGLQESSYVVRPGQVKGTRRSARQKKPPTKWNEDARFVAEPPRSVKKISVREGTSEGMPSTPLLISDWSDAQISNYCNACGIFFSDSDSHQIDCINYIRNLEMMKGSPVVGQTETPVEVRQAGASSEARKC